MAIDVPLTFGDIADTTRPLAIAVHGFPDTPHTWRHLGPVLADRGYRVAAPGCPPMTHRRAGRSVSARMCGRSAPCARR